MAPSRPFREALDSIAEPSTSTLPPGDMQAKSKLDKLSRKLLLPFTQGKLETTRILSDRKLHNIRAGVLNSIILWQLRLSL